MVEQLLRKQKVPSSILGISTRTFFLPFLLGSIYFSFDSLGFRSSANFWSYRRSRPRVLWRPRAWLPASASQAEDRESILGISMFFLISLGGRGVLLRPLFDLSGAGRPICPLPLCVLGFGRGGGGVPMREEASSSPRLRTPARRRPRPPHAAAATTTNNQQQGRSIDRDRGSSSRSKLETLGTQHDDRPALPAARAFERQQSTPPPSSSCAALPPSPRKERKGQEPRQQHGAISNDDPAARPQQRPPPPTAPTDPTPAHTHTTPRPKSIHPVRATHRARRIQARQSTQAPPHGLRPGLKRPARPSVQARRLG